MASRHRVLTIDESVEVPPEKIDPSTYRGVYSPSAGELTVKYNRKDPTGNECPDPLRPVYLDSLIEALAFVASITAARPEHVTLLGKFICEQLMLRLGIYSRAQFLGFDSYVQSAKTASVINKNLISEMRQAYEDYLVLQLNGVERPCDACGVPSCNFRGQFDRDDT